MLALPALFSVFKSFSSHFFTAAAPGLDPQAPPLLAGARRLSGMSLTTGTSSEGSASEERRGEARGGNAFCVVRNGAEQVAGLLPGVRQSATT